jgi:hypothetical protein
MLPKIMDFLQRAEGREQRQRAGSKERRAGGREQEKGDGKRETGISILIFKTLTF